MGNDLDQKIKELTSFDTTAEKYGLMYAAALDELLDKKEAYEHGESPVMGNLLFNQDLDKYIKNIPLYDNAHKLALTDFMVKNNALLLDVVRMLISQHEIAWHKNQSQNQ